MEQLVLGAVIVIDCDTVSAQPLTSVTMSVTVYVPGSDQACDVLISADVAASPKFHDQLVPPDATIGTSVPTHAVAGRVNAAVGGVGIITVCVEVTKHVPSDTVSVTTCGPGVAKETGPGT